MLVLFDLVLQAQTVIKKYFPYLKIQSQYHDALKRKEYNLLPILYRSPETGVATGIVLVALFKPPHTKDSTTRTSNLGIPLIISEAGQKIAIVQGNIMFNKDRIFWRSLNIIEDFKEQYWGIGNKARWEDHEYITYKLLRLQHRVSARVFRKHYIGLQHHLYSAWDIAGDSTLYLPDALGNRGMYTSGMGVGYLFDNRDNIVNTYKGTFIDIGTYHYHKVFGSEYGFSQYKLDFRQFFEVVKNQVLAYQLIFEYNEGNVTFMQMAHMGGAVAMRGYYYGRYRDKIHHTLQAEYRVKLTDFFGFVIFGGMANIANTWSTYEINTLKVAGGAGIRLNINKQEKVFVRLDGGIGEIDTRTGENSYGIYFHVGEAF
ncbi:MAG: BamA/TamA family outer membrane protein [Cytophagales bacterium]|nr:BamA/TamA family outer membrane protein [Cytophagales bacterium]